MENVQQFFRHLITNLGQYAALAGTLLTVLGAAASTKLFSRWIGQIPGSKIEIRDRVVGDAVSTDSVSERTSIALDSAPVIVKKTPAQATRNQAIFRLNEAKQVMTSQEGVAKAAKISNNLLIVGQYIIGGVLASSFVQESLTPKWVGSLGVLVLIASLVKQQFHPDLNAGDARKKASQLKALIRTSEDQLAILNAKMASGEDHSDAIIALLTQITQKLNEIEHPEELESKQ
jgi:hypothetical protein